MSTEKKYNWWEVLIGRPTIDKLEATITKLDADKDELEVEITDLENELEGVESHLEEMILEYTEARQTILELNRIIAESWKPIWIMDHIGDRVEYNPWNESFHPISSVWFGDPKYYTLPYDAWMSFLPDIATEVQRMITSKQHLMDCENYATVMAAFVAMSFGKTRIKYQGAFVTMRSAEHDFNGFSAHDEHGVRTLYVFEPQDGTVIGTVAEARLQSRYRAYLLNFVN